MTHQADVVVVGGGVTGCATAYYLSKRGRKVVLLEKDDIAFEASSRTMAAIGLLGKQEGEFLLAQEGLKLYRQLSDDLNYDVEFIEGGRLIVSEAPADSVYFEEMVKEARESGVEFEVLDRQEAKRRFPYLRGPFNSVAYSPNEGHVNPVRTVQAYANAARENGAEIVTDCSVFDIGVTGGKVTSVHTSQGEIRTGVVVNAAGVWAGRLNDKVGLHTPTQLIRLAQGETEPLPPLFQPFIRSGTFCVRQTASGTVRVTNGYRDQGVYHDLSLQDFRDMKVWLPRLLKQRKTVSFRIDTDLLKFDIQNLLSSIGGRRDSRVAPVGLEAQPAPKKVRSQLADASRLIPQLKKASLVSHWAGYIDLTPDLLPILGRVDQLEGLYLSMGFSGHGFALGPIVGKIMSELIMDGESSVPIEPFSAGRFVSGKVEMPRRLM